MSDTATPTRRREIVASGGVLPLTELAYNKLDQARVELIEAACMPSGCALPVFYAFLELSVRYDLDPLAREISLGVIKGRPTPMIGRDGYLKVARKDTRHFIDVDADVVCEHDDYAVVRKADGTRTIEHSYGNPSKRGKVTGAFGVLQRHGYPDRYFFAPRDEYAKDPSNTAWGYLHAMMIKAPTSYLCRVTYGVSGAAPVDEMNSGLVMPVEHGIIDDRVRPVDSPRLPERLHGLVLRAAQIDPKAWRANEVQARLPLDDDPAYGREVAALGDEIEKWLAEHEIRDAVVVPDDEPAARTPARPVDASPSPAPTTAAPDETIDPFTAAMREHDASTSAPADGVETTDVPADLQARWDAPEHAEWRQQVEPLLNQRTDLEHADVPDDRQDEINEELRHLDASLDALGVPTGWWPASADQARFDV